MALATTGRDLTTVSDADEILDHVLATPEGQADPYPAFARLRALAPVHHSGLDGHWYASTFDACKQVLSDPRFAKGPLLIPMRHGMDQARVESSARRRRPSMIVTDPPEHTRLRGAAKGAFIPPRMQGIRPLVAELVEARLDALASAVADGRGDLMDDVAFPLPVSVISALVGVPAEDRDLFRPLLDQIVNSDQAKPDPDAVRRAEESFDAFQRYFEALIKERRKGLPGEDLLSTLISAFEAGDLSGEELYGTVSLVFIAGFLTTTNLLGNGLVALLDHPDQRDRLWSDPDHLVEPAVEEMLRYDTPVQLVHRIAKEDLDLAGVPIPAGGTVFALLGAAGRDPAHFPEPDAFRIARPDNLHLSFAWGPHFCLGARLARLEAQLVFEGLVRRFARIEITGEPVRRKGLFIRGLESLPVRVTAAKAAVSRQGRPGTPRPMAKIGYQLDEDDKEAISEFAALVNMTSRELESWLRSSDAGEVDEPSLRVVSILGKRRVDYNVGDIAYMRKTVGYINRLLSQRPPEGAADPGWRQALMRWGHDPSKGDAV